MKTKCLSCGGTTKKMQKGGSTDTSITGKIQKGLDWMLGSDNLRKIGRETNAKLQPAAQKGRDYLNKTLGPLKPKSTVAKIEKKQAGGSLPKAQNGRNVIKRIKITGPIPRPTPKKTETGFGKGPIKTIKKVIDKLKTRKTKPGCFGASCGKMQNGGMIPKCPGPNCPKRPKNGITKAIKKIVKKTRTIERNGTKQTDTPYGNFPKNMSQPQPKKMQNGGVKK